MRAPPPSSGQRLQIAIPRASSIAQLYAGPEATLAGPAGTITRTSPLWPGQKAIYQALSITPPPRVSAFETT